MQEKCQTCRYREEIYITDMDNTVWYSERCPVFILLRPFCKKYKETTPTTNSNKEDLGS